MPNLPTCPACPRIGAAGRVVKGCRAHGVRPGPSGVVVPRDSTDAVVAGRRAHDPAQRGIAELKRDMVWSHWV